MPEGNHEMLAGFSGHNQYQGLEDPSEDQRNAVVGSRGGMACYTACGQQAELMQAQRAGSAETFYPDANSTLRLSAGHVDGSNLCCEYNTYRPTPGAVRVNPF